MPFTLSGFFYIIQNFYQIDQSIFNHCVTLNNKRKTEIIFVYDGALSLDYSVCIHLTRKCYFFNLKFS